MLMQFLQTAGATVLLLVGSAAVLTWLNQGTLQAVVDRTRTDSDRLWFAKPGLWFHEAAHAVVGRLFGLRIRQFSVRSDGQAAGHVTFAFDPRSLWQRLGLFASAGAPVWLAGVILLVVGKHAFWAGVTLANIGVETLAPRPGWILAWVVLLSLLSLGANLSRADFSQMLRGLPVAIVLIVLVFFALLWLHPEALATWWQLNQLAGQAILVLVLFSAVLNRLVA